MAVSKKTIIAWSLLILLIIGMTMEHILGINIFIVVAIYLIALGLFLTSLYQHYKEG